MFHLILFWRTAAMTKTEAKRCAVGASRGDAIP
jgi:hypothetical protein